VSKNRVRAADPPNVVRGLKVRGLTNFTRARDTACKDTSRRSFLTTLGTVAAAPLLARDYGAGAGPDPVFGA